MHIHGMVGVEAVVRPNGTVKSTRILGGNPVLIEAANDAVTNGNLSPRKAKPRKSCKFSSRINEAINERNKIDRKIASSTNEVTKVILNAVTYDSS